MPGRIQSLERGAAVLSLLGAASPDLSLAEVADALGLARPTAHGLLATLVHVGFVAQDEHTRRYRLGPGLTSLQQHGVDRHDLRSTATSWCDSLAARTWAEVLVCVRVGDAAEVVHHVFRPDGSEQRLRVGERLPLHATAVGRALLAASTGGRHALVGPLTDPAAHGGDPADAFDLVIPSLPGHGFSIPLTTTGLTIPRHAELFAELMTGVLGYHEAPLVSIDFNHDSHSSTVDLAATKVLGGRLARVAAWYDNEWGFSCRMGDVAALLGKL